MRLEVKLRKDSKGRICAAPFINNYNVWDIPKKEWTKDVQTAIKSAYCLGVEHAAEGMIARTRDAVIQITYPRKEWPAPNGIIK